jgi:acylphosphatase
MERREVIYRGRVQGVGFRYTCQRIAAECAITGFVRNLPDGSVQLVAEGDDEELDRFLAEIARVMGDYIVAVHTDRLDATRQYAGFEIRH